MEPHVPTPSAGSPGPATARGCGTSCVKGCILGCGGLTALSLVAAGVAVAWFMYPYPVPSARTFLRREHKVAATVRVDLGNPAWFELLERLQRTLSEARHRELPPLLRPLAIERDVDKLRNFRLLPAFEVRALAAPSADELRPVFVAAFPGFGKLAQCGFWPLARLVPPRDAPQHRGATVITFQAPGARRARSSAEPAPEASAAADPHAWGLTTLRGCGFFGCVDPTLRLALDAALDGEGPPLDTFLARRWPTDGDGDGDGAGDADARLLVELGPGPTGLTERLLAAARSVTLTGPALPGPEADLAVLTRLEGFQAAFTLGEEDHHRVTLTFYPRPEAAPPVTAAELAAALDALVATAPRLALRAARSALREVPGGYAVTVEVQGLAEALSALESVRELEAPPTRDEPDPGNEKPLEKARSGPAAG